MNALFRNPITLAAGMSVVALIGILTLKGIAYFTTLTKDTATDARATHHLDSDSDGVPDWQEHLMGTDPYDPDSDDDGVPDTYTPLPNLYQIAGTSTDEESSLTTQLASDLVSQYLALTQEGYSREKGIALGTTLASRVSTSTAYRIYTEEEVTITSDASYQRMLDYRSDLRTALEPLLENTTPEFELYGRAIATGDTHALTELYHAATRYDDAAKRMMDVSTPREALASHIAAVNALTHFAAVLREMVRVIHDPLASAALIREYNTAERDTFDAFNAQASYFAEKYRAHVSYESH